MKHNKAVLELTDTADFAAVMLGEVEQSGKLGKGTLAGKCLEARTRLQAAAALVRKIDPAHRELEVKTRVLRAMALDESAWGAGSMHVHGAVCWVQLRAATIPDALAMIERLNPLTLGNTPTYKASYLPLDGPEFLKSAKGAEPPHTTCYTGHLEALAGHATEFELHCFVQAGQDVVQVRISVDDFSPIRLTYRRVDFMGGWRIEGTEAHGWHSYFTKCYRMWSSGDHPSPYTFAA